MNTTQKTDVMWKCLAVSIFSTCAITSWSNDNIEGHSEPTVMSVSDPVLSTPDKNSVTLNVTQPTPLGKTDQNTPALINNVYAVNVGATNDSHTCCTR